MNNLAELLLRLASLLESLVLSLKNVGDIRYQIDAAVINEIAILERSALKGIPAGEELRQLHWRSQRKIETIATDLKALRARTRLLAEAFGVGRETETQSSNRPDLMAILAGFAGGILSEDARRMRSHSNYFARYAQSSATHDYERIPPRVRLRRSAGDAELAFFRGPVGDVEPVTRLATLIPVMFATDRQPRISSDSNFVRFNDGRGQDELSFGVAEVSIPPGHRMGRLERPALWKFQFHEDSEKHVTVTTCELKGESEWKKIAEDRLNDASRRQALVFIHGFNVGFDESIRRAAQIGFDLQFDGLLAAYSWCSEAKTRLYVADEDNIVLTVPHLLRFLLLLRQDMKIDVIHVIAHSMGSRALLSAIERFPSLPEHSLNEVVFAAPDVDADIFKKAVTSMRGKVARYTLYGSDKDLALVAAKAIRKGMPRAGDGGSNVLVTPDVETIDASAVGADMLGLNHSYFASKRTVLSDIHYVVRESLPAAKRSGLLEQALGQLKYWVFQP
jgi:esterase/lipase superfamily enzyme